MIAAPISNKMDAPILAHENKGENGIDGGVWKGCPGAAGIIPLDPRPNEEMTAPMKRRIHKIR